MNLKKINWAELPTVRLGTELKPTKQSFIIFIGEEQTDYAFCPIWPVDMCVDALGRLYARIRLCWSEDIDAFMSAIKDKVPLYVDAIRKARATFMAHMDSA